MKQNVLLLADGVVNLLLGLALVVFPIRLAALLGIPTPDTAFYPSLLGAVLFGIGIALLVERSRQTNGLIGLGLGGAIAINICGSLVLAYWLISGELAVTTPGSIILWAIVIIVFGLAVLEAMVYRRSSHG
jgi:hypothetical protein